jgi:DNA-binding NarL/FixJ family response regulator
VGATNPIIAGELAISRSTVASHVTHILDKLGAANRTEAVQLAAVGGLAATEAG